MMARICTWWRRIRRGQFVIANDAGLDLTLIWRLDAQGGRLLPADAPVLVAPPGSAPRHFVFHPSGKFFYNLYEHDAKVVVYDYDASRGAMRLKQSVSTLPPNFAGSNLASEILVSRRRALPVCQQSIAQHARDFCGGGGRPAAK